MKTSWTTWLLAGALLASLQWNLSQHFRARDARPAAAECRVDPQALGLSDEQTEALRRLCRARCAEAGELQAHAEERLDALRAALADPQLDEADLRARVREVSALRERALAACVDSVLSVREVLDDAQLAALLEVCCGVQGDGAAGCDVGPCGP